MELANVINGAYLISAILFFFGFKRLSSPATARSGNLLAALGMLIAVVVTLFNEDILSFELIIAGIIIGSLIGVLLARYIKMTAMPQMVAIFNGFGGGASTTVAAAELLRLRSPSGDLPADASVTILASVLIGAVTFSGSIIAFGKLQNLVTSRAVVFPLQKPINAIIFLGCLAIIGFIIATVANLPLFILLIGLALLLGILLVVPIGGADMPVVIALLNSYSGLAAAAAGFAVNNTILIIAGALVGASGLILTSIMCRAMNRSIFNVMFGGFGATAEVTGATAGRGGARPVRSATADDAAIALAYARTVIFVPGYGLAVAQAQHAARELADLLRARGVNVKYAIHPVAGRMPGHMNVLLAEANVPYDQLYDLEQINADFDDADVAVVVGANDVTNPAARDVTDSPIYGMPILNVDRARSIIFIKRSLSPGFAGIDNDLFYGEKTMMYFADAKKALSELATAVKNV